MTARPDLPGQPAAPADRGQAGPDRARLALAVISAGLRQPSSTRLLADRLAAATGRALRERDMTVDTTTVELRDHARDLTNSLLAGFPTGGVRPVLDRVLAADALIVVTPVFNGSYSGLFKLFFDVLEAGSLRGRPVLLGATGGTARHSLALEHALRPLFSYLGSLTVPTAVFAGPQDWGDAADDLDTRIDRAGAELAALAAGPGLRAGPATGATAATGATGAAVPGAGPAGAGAAGGQGRPETPDPFDDPVPFEHLLAGD